MPHRGQDHVLEATEDVTTDDIALVDAGERGHGRPRSNGHAQVVGPERDQPLDERALGRDACPERRAGLLPGDGPEPLAGSISHFLVACSLRNADLPESISRSLHHGEGLIPKRRRWSLELRREPLPRIPHRGDLARPRAEPVAVEHPQRWLHLAHLPGSSTPGGRPRSMDR